MSIESRVNNNNKMEVSSSSRYFRSFMENTYSKSHI